MWIGDLVYFAGMLFIVILMGLHLGLLNPLRRSITRLFEGGPGTQ